jgi:hypothetical protein
MSTRYIPDSILIDGARQRGKACIERNLVRHADGNAAAAIAEGRDKLIFNREVRSECRREEDNKLALVVGQQLA